MLIVSTLILVRHRAFNGAVLLRSQAYEIALATREVQLSAISAEGDGSGQFRSVEGVYFSTDTDNVYKTFRDADRDFFYDSSEEYGKPGVLDQRFEIRAIRATGDTISGNGVAVVFERPNFDAKFYDSGGRVNASKIEIDVSKRDESGNGIDVVRTVEITATGQIAVQ